MMRRCVILSVIEKSQSRRHRPYLYVDADIAAEAKRLMRDVLDHYLEERRIVSRRVVRDLVNLEEEGS